MLDGGPFGVVRHVLGEGTYERNGPLKGDARMEDERPAATVPHEQDRDVRGEAGQRFTQR
jgi:hypothetical protein